MRTDLFLHQAEFFDLISSWLRHFQTLSSAGIAISFAFISQATVPPQVLPVLAGSAVFFLATIIVSAITTRNIIAAQMQTSSLSKTMERIASLLAENPEKGMSTDLEAIMWLRESEPQVADASKRTADYTKVTNSVLSGEKWTMYLFVIGVAFMMSAVILSAMPFLMSLFRSA